MNLKVTAVCFIAIVALFLFVGCTNMGNDSNNGNTDLNNPDDNSGIYNNLNQFVKVKAGDTVSVYYVGKLTDGNVFDSSVGKDPLTFVAGTGEMIVNGKIVGTVVEGFRTPVIGMKVGDKKTIEISPEQGYGAINEDNKQWIPKEQLPADLNIDQVIIVGQYRLKVYEMNDQNVLASVNHFLAGQTLIFDIILVSIN